jgi:hypothetical protein
MLSLSLSTTSVLRRVLSRAAPPLDQIGVASAAAYSLRKVRNAYTGSAVRVRRSSDNTETDIGFTASGDLNTAALMNHVGYQNLLTYSEQADNVVWTFGDAVTPNLITSPDGTTTADLVQVVGASTLRQAFTTPISGQTVTASCCFKLGLVGEWVRISVFDPLVPTNQFRAWFNPNTGQLGVSDQIGTGVHIGAGIENIGNGWYRGWVTGQIPSTSLTIQLSNENSNGVTARTAGQNRYQWGAQINLGTLQPYQQTVATARAGNGFVTTWYDQSGNGRNATQTTAGLQPRIVNNGVVEAINGKPEIRFDGVDDYLAAPSPLIDTTHSLFVLFTPTIENQIGSLFGQWSAGQTGRFFLVANQDSGGLTSAGRLNPFNSSATGGGGGGGGSGFAADVAISNTPTLITSISSTGSEQWKLFKNGAEWDSATITSVFTGVNSAIGSSNGTGSSNPFDGTVSELISFPSVLSTTDRQTLERNQGAYYGIPSLALDQIGVASAAAYSLRKVRNAYTGSAVRVRRSSDNTETDIGFTASGDLDTTALLNHVGYENLLLRSEEVNQSPWVLDNSGASNPVVTANYASAPDGAMTADRVQLNKTGGTFSRLRQPSVQPSSNTYTYSVYLKNNSAGVANVGIRIDDVGVNCVVTQDWQRFSVTKAATTVPECQILLFDSIVGNDETADILVWGNQLNTGATPKTYQQTVATAKTGNGFITTWYDQSGNNRHATQTTAGIQPRIVNAGVIDIANGKPAIRFNGSNTFFSGVSLPLSQFTLSSVLNDVTQLPNIRYSIGTGSASPGRGIFSSFTGFAPPTPNASLGYAPDTGSVVQTGFLPTTGQSYVVSLTTTATASSIWANGGNNGTGGRITLNQIFIGQRGDGFWYYDGHNSETIVFPSVLSTTDRQTLERNQGGYYTITVS